MKSEVCLKYFDHDCYVVANKFKGFFGRFSTLTSIFLLTNKKERERERQTDRQTETQTETQTDRQTETQTDRQTDRQERVREKRGSVCTVSTRSWVRIPLGPTFYMESKKLSSK